MRLIDADKIEYMWQQDRNGKFHDGVTLESIVDNTPTINSNDLIVKEFEKIRINIRNRFKNDCHYDSFTVNEIDKYIGYLIELKGDGNDERKTSMR